VIQRRMRDAVNEMRHYDSFDYVVINDRFEEALADLHAIVRCQRLQRRVQAQRHAQLLTSLLA
jgi:guanylate kinase